jgi:Flp pilus assembly CpaE family ATPase/CheY-like chemotaxis protein
MSERALHQVLLAGLSGDAVAIARQVLLQRGAEAEVCSSVDEAAPRALDRGGKPVVIVAPASAVPVLTGALPGNPVLAVLPEGAGVAEALAAQRAGASQVTGLPLSAQDFADALDGILRLLPADSRRGRVIGVLGVTGGCGATTLALTLGQECGARVLSGNPGCVVIEVPKQMGALSAYLGIEPRVTSRDVLSDPQRITPQGLRSNLHSVSAGLEVLPGHDQGLVPSALPARGAARLAEAARAIASAVFLDLPCSLDDALFEALAACDTVLLVGVQSVASVRALRTVRDLLVREEGLRSIEVVVNKYDASLMGFEAPSLAEVLGIPAVWAVSDDDAALAASATHCRPLREAAPHSPLALDVRRLATALLGAPTPPPSQPRPPSTVPRRVRILHIEDDPVPREIVAIHLRRIKGLDCVTFVADSEEAGVERFLTERPDLVLLDYHLQQGDGMGCLRKLRALDPLVPILVVSGLNEPGLAARLLAAGADDFLSKENLGGDRLHEAVRTALDRAGAMRSRRRPGGDSLLSLVTELQGSSPPGRFSVGTIQRLSDQLCAELEKAAPGPPLPRRAVLSFLLRLLGTAG